MHYEAKNIRIIGMSAAVPEACFDNFLDSKGDKKLERLLNMTGIYRRHVLDLNTHKLVDMAILAARKTIEESKVDTERIRALVYVTQKPEFFCPSTAFYVQKELNLNKNCIVFDVNLGCSGFVAGLQIISSLLESQSEGDLALLINAESMTPVIRDNPNDMLLFGDACTATLLMKDFEYTGKYISDYYSDGSRYKSIFHPEQDSSCYMDGQAVFEFSIYEVSGYIKEFLEKNSIDADNVDHIVFHQAQKFIIDHLASEAKLDVKKLLYSLDEYGNTSGASIPLSICCNDEKLNGRERILISGFGVGLAWGVAYIEIDASSVFGIVTMK